MVHTVSTQPTDILNTLEGMYVNQASISNTITALPKDTWMLHYQNLFGVDCYQSHLHLHALMVSHKIDFLYELLITEIEKLISGIATFSKGYLPPKLFPLSFLRNIMTRVARKFQNDRRGYRLVFDHESTYYDMQLATFSLDEFHNLVVTFPIFIVPLDHRPFPLYELETVPVPIEDQDDHASSFSEVRVNKPYFCSHRCSIHPGPYS